MSFDQQIQIYEDRITQLEEMKKLLLTKSDYFSGIKDHEVIENYLTRINLDLDENYQHVTILKIRKMMGF